jgi:hypothetical protein
MSALVVLSKFRAGDKVRVEAKGDFYGFIDGWPGVVAAVGPKPANACHSQIPEGYACVEVERDGTKQFLVPFDELVFSF